MQNKLVILALLGSTISANPDKKLQPNATNLSQVSGGPMKMMAPTKLQPKSQMEFVEESEKKAFVPPMHKAMAPPQAVHEPMMKKMTVGLARPSFPLSAKEMKSQKELKKDVKSMVSDPQPTQPTPLMSVQDQRCYQARFFDLKGQDANAHYTQKGMNEGRLATCARDLTDYEAQDYLNQFPDLQAKFGRGGKVALERAKEHYQKEGYLSTKYAESMKNLTDKAWKCGPAPNTECKCHGTLYLGAAKRPDNQKPISSWEEFRLFKTVTKQNAGFSLCNASDFGSDPHPGKGKECWCEDKPLYQPNLCAGEGKECLCNGHVLYGPRLSKDGKQNSFQELIAGRFAVTTVADGKNAVSCEGSSFNGADPSPEGEKMCLCDQEKKFFDKKQIALITSFWTQEMEVTDGKTEVEISEKIAAGLEKDVTVKAEEFMKEIEIQDLERQATLKQIETSRNCVATAKEAARKFKETQIMRKYLERKRAVELQRQRLAQWRGKITMKYQAAIESCALASRSKDPIERARLLAECTRLKTEVSQEKTDIDMQTNKTNETEQKNQEDEAGEQTKLTNENRDQDSDDDIKEEILKNELEEKTSENKESILKQKVDLEKKKAEILQLKNETKTKIATALANKKNLIKQMITKHKETIAKLTREETSTVDEDNDEDFEKVTTSITKRAEKKIEEAEKKITTYKEKVEKIETKLKDKAEALIKTKKKVTELKAVIEKNTDQVVQQTKVLKAKQEFHEKNPTITKVVEEYKELQTTITTTEKLIKTTTVEYVEVVAEEYVTTEVIEFYVEQKKDLQQLVAEATEEVEDGKSIVSEVKHKKEVHEKVQKVITKQQKAFLSHQKVIEVEEELNEVVQEKEKKVSELVIDKTKEETTIVKKKEELEKENRKKVVVENVIKTSETEKEKAKFTKEVTVITKNIEKITKVIEKREKRVEWFTKTVTYYEEEYGKIITTLKEKVEKNKKDAKTDEEEAGKSVTDLPGGDLVLKPLKPLEPGVEPKPITVGGITVTPTPPPLEKPAEKPKEQKPLPSVPTIAPGIVNEKGEVKEKVPSDKIKNIKVPAPKPSPKEGETVEGTKAKPTTPTSTVTPVDEAKTPAPAKPTTKPGESLVKPGKDSEKGKVPEKEFLKPQPVPGVKPPGKKAPVDEPQPFVPTIISDPVHKVKIADPNTLIDPIPVPKGPKPSTGSEPSKEDSDSSDDEQDKPDASKKPGLGLPAPSSTIKGVATKKPTKELPKIFNPEIVISEPAPKPTPGTVRPTPGGVELVRPTGPTVVPEKILEPIIPEISVCILPVKPVVITKPSPVSGLENVTQEVSKKTVDAKNKRIQCTKSSKKLQVERQRIDQAIQELKEELEEKKDKIFTCKENQQKYEENMADLNKELAKVVGNKVKSEAINTKIGALQALKNGQDVKCKDDVVDTAAYKKEINKNRGEVKQLVAFVKENCREAVQAESEVEDIINLVTHVEVTNRLYVQYVQVIQVLQEQEKNYELHRVIYERERKRHIILITEHHHRIETSKKSVTVLKEKVDDMKKIKEPTSAVEKNIKRIEEVITEHEKVIEEETTTKETHVTELKKVEKEFEKVVTTTNVIRRQVTRIKEEYEEKQTKIVKKIEDNEKITSYRKKLTSNQKTLTQKIQTVTTIITEIKEEITSLKKKVVTSKLQIEDCTKKSSVAQDQLTVAKSKLAPLAGELKMAKGDKEKKKVNDEIVKFTKDEEAAQNALNLEVGTCQELKQEVTTVTKVVVKYEVEYKYYTELLVKTQKELKETTETVTVVINGKKPEEEPVDPEDKEIDELDDDDTPESEKPKKEEKKEEKKDDEKKDDKKEKKEEESAPGVSKEQAEGKETPEKKKPADGEKKEEKEEDEKKDDKKGGEPEKPGAVPSGPKELTPTEQKPYPGLPTKLPTQLPAPVAVKPVPKPSICVTPPEEFKPTPSPEPPVDALPLDPSVEEEEEEEEEEGAKKDEKKRPKFKKPRKKMPVKKPIPAVGKKPTPQTGVISNKGSTTDHKTVEYIEGNKKITDEKITTLVEEFEKVDEEVTTTIEEVVKIKKDKIVIDGQNVETQKEVEKTKGKRERQQCAMLFPKVFTSFNKEKAKKEAGMCPCQSSTSGASKITVILSSDAEGVSAVKGLFGRGLIIDAQFKTEVSRTSYDNNGLKVIESESEVQRLEIITSDERVPFTLNMLDGQLGNKSDFVVSPFTTGKKSYMRWVARAIKSLAPLSA